MQVTSSSSAAASLFGGTDSSSVLPKQTLGQDDFLKLLITQMSSQDPMNPMSNADFIAQMAQFSTLEQTRSMESEMTAIHDQQAIVQANGLIGRDVDLVTDQGTEHGTVSAVQISDGTPQLIVNGTSYDLNQVVKITPAATSQT